MTETNKAAGESAQKGMSLLDARDILDEHNRWRRGAAGGRQNDPKLIGIAIDMAVEALDRLAALPKASGEVVINENKLWGFLRDVLSQGTDIQHDYIAGRLGNYEGLSGHLDAAAAARMLKLVELLRASPPVEKAVPPGWKLVPIEPSVAQLIAGNHAEPGSFSAATIYRAMLAAAPEPKA